MIEFLVVNSNSSKTLIRLYHEWDLKHFKDVKIIRGLASDSMQVPERALGLNYFYEYADGSGLYALVRYRRMFMLHTEGGKIPISKFRALEPSSYIRQARALYSGVKKEEESLEFSRPTKLEREAAKALVSGSRPTAFITLRIRNMAIEEMKEQLLANGVSEAVIGSELVNMAMTCKHAPTKLEALTKLARVMGVELEQPRGATNIKELNAPIFNMSTTIQDQRRKSIPTAKEMNEVRNVVAEVIDCKAEIVREG